MKKVIIIATLIVLVAGSVGYIFWSSYSFDTENVVRGTVTQKVSETGRIVSEEDFDLSFKAGGEISSVYAKIGTEVKKGDPLVELDKRELEIQLSRARAERATARARSNQLIAGAKNEDIRVYESAVTNAKTNVANAEVQVKNSEVALNDANASLVDKISDAFTKSDDAVRNNIDKTLINPRSSNPRVDFAVPDSALKSSIENQRVAIESLFTSWESSLESITVVGDLNSYIFEAKSNLEQIKSFSDDIALAINSVPDPSSSRTLDAWKSNVASARVSISVASSALLAAEEKVNGALSAKNTADGDLVSAEGGLKKAEDELASIKADPRGVDVAVFENQVRSADGTIALLQKQLNDVVLRAPSDGVVSDVFVERGEHVAPNQVAVSLISESRFELEAYISEESIVEVVEGALIEFTLDAFSSDERFVAEVALIEPAATIIEEEVYYKVKGEITEDIEGIREGMTADVDIIIGRREGVIVVSSDAVKEIDGKNTIWIATSSTTKDLRVIEIGLEGEGLSEVISGLSEGDAVVVR